MSSPSPACPFCQSHRVTALAVEGVQGEVMAFHCDDCGKQWSEIPIGASARARAASDDPKR